MGKVTSSSALKSYSKKEKWKDLHSISWRQNRNMNMTSGKGTTIHGLEALLLEKIKRHSPLVSLLFLNEGSWESHLPCFDTNLKKESNFRPQKGLRQLSFSSSWRTLFKFSSETKIAPLRRKGVVSTFFLEIALRKRQFLETSPHESYFGLAFFSRCVHSPSCNYLYSSNAFGIIWKTLQCFKHNLDWFSLKRCKESPWQKPNIYH